MSGLVTRFAAVALLFVLLSGCSSDPESQAPANATSDGLLADDVEQDGDGSDVIDAGVSVPRLAVLEIVNATGTAPLDVAFVIDAEGPNASSWVLDFGDATASLDGTTFPANVTHTYSTNGSFAANLTITYDDGETASATQTITVAAGGPAPGVFLRTDVIDRSGTLLLTVQDVLGQVACGSGVNGSATYSWEFVANDPATGAANVASEVRLALDGGQTVVDADIYFYAPDGAELGKGTSGNPDESVTVPGPLMPGAYSIKVLGCISVNGSFTVHGEADFVTA